MKIVYLAILCLAAGPAFGQFRDLSTDRHGTKVVLSTALTLLGEVRNDEPKLIVATQGGVATLRNTPAEIPSGQRYPSNFPQLVSPELSSDGLRYAFTGQRWCVGGSGCVAVERLNGNVRDSNDRLLAGSGGRARISANGRWAVFTGTTSLANPYRFVRVDLETNSSEWESSGAALNAPVGRRAVADNGTVVWASGNSLWMRPVGSLAVPVPLPVTAAMAVVSDDARFAVVQTEAEPPSLWIVDLLSKATIPAVWAYEGCRQPSLSEDGMSLMFVSAANWEGRNDTLTPQVWVMDLISGHLKQVTSGNDAVLEATISGDGKSVWAATQGGRVIRVDVGAGSAEEVIAATPWTATTEPWMLAPGGRYSMTGSGLKTAEVRVNELAADIVKREPDRVDFIVPWGVPGGAQKVLIGAAGSPFQPVQLTWEFRETAPRFERWGSLPMIWHEGGMRAVWEKDPAGPGEVIEIRMTGMGPLDAQGRTTAPLGWDFYESPGAIAVAPQVIESGIEWNEPGLYRVKLRLSQFSPGAAALVCRDARDSAQSDYTALATAP